MMKKRFITEQEAFWAGAFGDEYVERNQGEDFLAAYVRAWSQMLHWARSIGSVLELGPNRGLNLQALGMLFPKLSMTGVEINAKAAEVCSKLERVEVVNTSIFDYTSEETFDLTFTAGVLIHIAPDMLSKVYDVLYKHSKKYILIAEYYSPTPMEVDYRGNDRKLFRRDFAGEILDLYTDLELIDYGFHYHRDAFFPEDDITWFLMKK